MILVIGATGTVGSELVRMLAEEGRPVRALTRSPEKASFPEGVEVVKGDLEQPETLDAAFAGVDGVFAVVHPGVGPEGPVMETAVVEAAKKAGVTRLVKLSTSGVEYGATDALSQAHRRGEDVVKASGLEWTVLRPGTFMSNLKMHIRGIRAADTVFSTEGDPTSAMVHPRDIAAVAREALLGDGHSGQTYVLTGAEAITPQEAVDTLGEVLGRPIKHVVRSEDETRKIWAERGWGDEDTVNATFDLKRQSAEWDWKTTDAVERVAGRPPLTLRDWVAENRAVFG